MIVAVHKAGGDRERVTAPRAAAGSLHCLRSVRAHRASDRGGWAPSIWFGEWLYSWWDIFVQYYLWNICLKWMTTDFQSFWVCVWSKSDCQHSKKKKKIKGQLANAVVRDWLLVEAGWGIFFSSSKSIYFAVMCTAHSWLLSILKILHPLLTRQGQMVGCLGAHT